MPTHVLAACLLVTSAGVASADGLLSGGRSELQLAFIPASSYGAGGAGLTVRFPGGLPSCGGALWVAWNMF